jgi:glycine cleavage system H protein
MTKQASDLNFPKEFKYTKTHEWAKVDGKEVVVGLDDFAQDQLGDIVFVEMPAVGAKFKREAVFANVESVKAVSECYMPVGGEITAVNETLSDDPELVNGDCYGKGWFVKIKADDLSEMDKLMDAAQCRKSVESKGE